MPYKDKPIEKQYYQIGEVAEMLGEKASLIRFWEKEFEVLKPKKNLKGNRLFTKKDVETLQIIHFLVKEKGYTLQGARDYLKFQATATKDKLEIIRSLENTREFLVSLRDNLGESS